jgi:hypothetical protein
MSQRAIKLLHGATRRWSGAYAIMGADEPGQYQPCPSQNPQAPHGVP